MHRLLIDPFAEDIAMARSKDSVILDLRTAQGEDKAILLDALFLKFKGQPIDEIILVNGPGNFTHLRVALGFVRGLALGLNIPSRGIGIFDIDGELSQQYQSNATLIRDARGQKFYHARTKNGQLEHLTLTDSIPDGAFSFERIEGVKTLFADLNARFQALAKLAQSDIGQCPASAVYIRSPQASLPSERPLVILDDQ